MLVIDTQPTRAANWAWERRQRMLRLVHEPSQTAKAAARLLGGLCADTATHGEVPRSAGGMGVVYKVFMGDALPLSLPPL